MSKVKSKRLPKNKINAELSKVLRESFIKSNMTYSKYYCWLFNKKESKSKNDGTTIYYQITGKRGFSFKSAVIIANKLNVNLNEIQNKFKEQVGE